MVEFKFGFRFVWFRVYFFFLRNIMGDFEELIVVIEDFLLFVKFIVRIVMLFVE